VLDTCLQDARYALRLLRRSPLFTLTAALSLAIGIGANITIFSIANALLLRPLPGLERPEQLVDVGRTQNGTGFDTVSYPNYRDLRERTRSIAGLYACTIEPQAMSLGGRGNAERVYGTVVTANYFQVLGTKPALGRLLQDSDDEVDGAHAAAVISHELWVRRFSADPNTVGTAVLVNNRPFMIVGVAPPGFQGTTLLKADLWVPVSALAEAIPRMRLDMLEQRRSVWLVMGGRLLDGVSLARANAELQAIGAALEREYPADNEGKSFTAARSSVVPGHTAMVAGFLGLLMAIVGLVLLIACVNVAGMLLARAVARQREIAIRLAVGAGRGRLIRQFLIETTMLFIAGGAAGLVLAKWLSALLLALLPQFPVPVALEVRADWRVVAFAVVLSGVAALLSGIVPALQASRASLSGTLKSDGLDRGPSRLRLRNAFVAGQVTMSVMLIIAAGLFLRALQRAADIPAGFDQSGVSVVSLDLSLAGYTAETAGPFMRDLLTRVGALPGVESATAAVDLPLDGGRIGLGGLTVPGRTPAPGRKFFEADWNIVEPGFFRTLRLPLLRGRDFTAADTPGSPGAAIVNQAFASAAWPHEDPLGRQVVVHGLENDERTLTIVGVAADARLITLGGAVEPYIYVPGAQQYTSRTSLLVRSADTRSPVPQVRELIRTANPSLPVTKAMPLSEVTALGLIPQRVAASVAGSLGLVGLLLAAIGIYGVTSYAVSHRTREIGVRIALGAARGSVIRLVLRQGMMLAAIGMAAGVALIGAVAVAASGPLEGMLYGVRGLDPITFAGACLVFAGVSMIASYLPARRASRVDPVVALRHEY
jgi:predicted permease